jgi:predicted acylesterase/phospholipase RssA
MKVLLTDWVRFVCATRHEDIDKVARVRSYDSSRQAIQDYATIWEAARATSAAPTFFDPIVIGRQTYGDGGMLANNPVAEVWSEARDLWYPKVDDISPHVKCILSIGTGDPGLRPVEEKIWGFVKDTLIGIATETRKTAEDFRQAHGEMFDAGRAFRFNVEQGLQDVGLEEHLKAGLILTATGSYMESQEHVDRVEPCASNLASKRCTFLLEDFS